MAIKIKFDNEQRALPPTLVLATRSGHKLGCIPAQHIVFHGSLTNGYELSCSVSKYDNWEKVELWDKLEDFKLAWSPEWDVWFELDVTTNESDDTVKNITATSIGEAELSQVMLYNIEINTETDIARDDYKPTIIYDPKDYRDSLLDRIMEKTPHYKIRHVDTSLAKLQRTFTFDGKSLRDALLEICKEVNALLVIHSGTDANGKIERAYSIYDLEEHCPNCGYRGEQVDGRCPECGKTEWSFGYGDDTGIFVSSENLADDITYETAKDSVKNCFRLVAGDDLMTAAVAAANPNGTGYLWYISDKVREDMSPALRNRLKEYDDLYKAIQDSSFSFTSAAIRNYNTLAAKYGKNQIGTAEKFAGVLDAYYDTIDFELYLDHGLLPDVDPPMTSAADELRKLIANISPVSVRTLTTLSSTTATSYVTQAARSIVDPRYSVSTKDETLNGNTWGGSFIITRYSDEEDTVTSDNISVSLDENYENFIRRQIERILNSSEFEDLDIVALFKKDGAAFASKIKQYSLAMLRSFYDACQACLNVLVEHNSANESIWAEIYHDLYEPYYFKLGYLQSEITLRESEITTVQAAQAEIESVIASTQDKLDFEKFMGEELWLEFAAYRREDTYQNDNYISDGLDNAALVENARDFLKTAQEEIERSATLQHSISANLSNLLVMEEFRGMTDNFELGNWLRIKVDDKVYILRLIDYEIDFDNLAILSVEYSDVVESPSSANDIKSVLNAATSMASSYGAISRQAKHGDNSQRQLNDWVSDGLEATKIKFLSDAVNQNITWDENGMLFRKWDEITESYEPTQLRIINSTIAVTDDNWKTVKTAVGGFDYKDPVTGEVKHGYGINAELLIGKLILGEALGLYNENNSLTFDRDGLTVTNGNNSFMVSPDGDNLFVVECGEGNKVMWVDKDGGLHLRPTEFSLTTGETLQDAIDEAKKARNLQIILTNEYEGIPTDANGNYDGELNVKTGVITYYGTEDVTDICTYGAVPSDGVIGSWDNTKHEYTITGLSTDSGYVSITSNYSNADGDEFTVTKQFNVSKVKAGTDGENGADGRGIKSTEVGYATSNQGKSPPESGWQEEMPPLTPGLYLWTRTVTAYTDNSPSTTSYSVGLIGVDGENGNDGRGISSTEIKYQKSDSGSVAPSTWLDNIPEVKPGEYLWTMTKFVYTDGSESVSYSVGMMGQTGMQGLQGNDGKDGINGKTTYLHIKYTSELKDDRSQIVMTEIPSAYIGILTDYTEADSTNPADYTWSKFIGDDGKNGQDGRDGVPGEPGADGRTSYFHVKYMTKDNHDKYEANPNDPSIVMTEYTAEFMGTYVDYKENDSTKPSDYTWMKVQGTDGIPGKNGENGHTSYLHIKYSDDGGITFTADNGEKQGAYIGQYVDFTEADSSSPSDYKWSRIEGIDGEDGAPGVSNYFHIRYSHIESPQTSTDMTEVPDDYIGTYVDEVKEDSNDPKKYTWTRFRGLQGADGKDGIPGQNGEDGTTYYLHIKYMTEENYTKFSANNDDPSVVMTETPAEYIGQLVDTTKEDSDIPKLYKWSRIEGVNGKDGEPARIFSLEVNVSAFVRDPETKLITPGKVVVSGYYKDGIDEERHKVSELPYPPYLMTAYAYTSTDGVNFVRQHAFAFDQEYDVKAGSEPHERTDLVIDEEVIAVRFILEDLGWSVSKPYIDMVTLPVIENGKDGTEMTPEQVFDKLTDYGNLQGMFVEEGGDVYLNASYIRSGTLIVGGLNNQYGQFEVRDSDDIKIGEINNKGIFIQTPDEQRISGIAPNGFELFFGTLGRYEEGEQKIPANNTAVLLSAHSLRFMNNVSETITDPTLTPGYFYSLEYNLERLDFPASEQGDSEDFNTMQYSGRRAHMFEMRSSASQYGTARAIICGAEYSLSRLHKLFSAFDEASFLNSSEVVAGKFLTYNYVQAVSTSSLETSIPSKTFNLSPIISTGSNYIDNGSGQCDENGECIIYLEDNFIDTSDISCIYQVFLTQIGDKKIDGVIEKSSLYFKVKGEPYSNFDWLILSNTNNNSTERFSQDKTTESDVLAILGNRTE